MSAWDTFCEVIFATFNGNLSLPINNTQRPQEYQQHEKYLLRAHLLARDGSAITPLFLFAVAEPS